MTIHSENTVEMPAPVFVHLEFAQMAHPPTGWTEADISAWLREFSQLLDDLRQSADRNLSDKQREYLVHLLNFDLDEFSDDHMARGALDYVREYAALHIADITGRTACERANSQRHMLPERARSYISSLARSHWDLYEVQSLENDGFVLRRLHDDTRHMLHAPEYNQPFVIGHVVALRLVDFGTITAAPLAIQLDHERVSELVHSLETEFANGRYRSDQWSEFMFHRGSFLVLRHALVDFRSYDKLETQENLETLPCPLELDQLVRLHSAFETLEAVINLEPERYHCNAVILPTADKRVIRIEDAGAAPGLLLFEDRESHDTYERYLHGDVSNQLLQKIAFRRAWRLPQELVHPDDVLRLERVGISPTRAGVVTPSRLLAGFIPADVSDEDVEQIITACYQAAAHLKKITDKAA